LPRLRFVLAKAGRKSLPEMVGFFLAHWDNFAGFWGFTPLESSSNYAARWQK
jgi:hypothetical protein